MPCLKGRRAAVSGRPKTTTRRTNDQTAPAHGLPIMNSADCEYVRAFMHERTGVVLEPAKDYLIEARFQTLAHREKLASPDAFVAGLRAEPEGDLARKVIDALLMGETSFFRDGHPFEALHRDILPELRNARLADRKLRVWCGASSVY